jgi:hypothetical protein
MKLSASGLEVPSLCDLSRIEAREVTGDEDMRPPASGLEVPTTSNIYQGRSFGAWSLASGLDAFAQYINYRR